MRKFIHSIMTDERQGAVAALIKFFLLILVPVYWCVIKIIDLGYRFGILKTFSFSKAVISIGNITMGGTGKTPFVEFLARFLKERGNHPVILTRGYMGEVLYSSYIAREGASLDVKSDEAVMLRQTLPDVPVVVDKDRVNGAARILEEYPADIFIMDDGFQHRRVKRDLNILIVDATNPFGNGCLLPRGILREPVSAIKRADMVVLTKTDLGQNNLVFIEDKIKAINPRALIVESVHQPCGLENLQSHSESDVMLLKNMSVAAFCSIGNPKGFEKTLTAMGARVRKVFPFMDHHVYQEGDIREIIRYAQSHDIKYVVTTSKDAVKLEPYQHLFTDEVQCLILKIKIKIIYEKEKLLNRIAALS